MPKLTKTKDRGWRDWYQLERWRKQSRYQLQLEPWCRFCAERGIAMPATIADHVEPHHGNPSAFWFGKLQSLCARCHSGAKAFAERHGYSQEIGSDGYPIDPNHPANLGANTSRRNAIAGKKVPRGI
jgi:5-methylcytosine-specific restriction protein A